MDELVGHGAPRTDPPSKRAAEAIPSKFVRDPHQMRFSRPSLSEITRIRTDGGSFGASGDRKSHTHRRIGAKKRTNLINKHYHAIKCMTEHAAVHGSKYITTKAVQKFPSL